MATDRMLLIIVIVAILVGVDLVAVMGMVYDSTSTLTQYTRHDECGASALKFRFDSQIDVKTPSYVPEGYDLICGYDGANCAPQRGCDPGYQVVYSNDPKTYFLAFNEPISAEQHTIVLTVVNKTLIYALNPNYYKAEGSPETILALNNTVRTMFNQPANITTTIQVFNISNRLTAIEQHWDKRLPNSVYFNEGNVTFTLESYAIPVSELEKIAASIG